MASKRSALSLLPDYINFIFKYNSIFKYKGYLVADKLLAYRPCSVEVIFFDYYGWTGLVILRPA